MKRRLIERHVLGMKCPCVQRRSLFRWVDDISPEGMQWLIGHLVNRKQLADIGFIPRADRHGGRGSKSPQPLFL